MADETDEAADLLSQANEMGYPEFTKELVTGTFDAVVSSMIEQQEAYADMLEKVAMEIEQFETETVSAQEVDAWMANNFANPSGSGSFVGTTDSPGDLTQDQVDRVHAKLGDTADDMENTSLPGTPSDDGGSGGESLDAGQVQAVRDVVRRQIAQPRMDALRELVTDGVVRLVVDDGTIETSMDFEVEASELREQIGRVRQKEAGHIGLIGNYVGGTLGIGLRGSYRNVKVSTERTRSRGTTEFEGEMTGSVTLNVRGDYVPLRQRGEGGGGG